jgi:SAM-dependent methyltransferase
MALKTLRDLGATSPESLILGVGAGREKTIFDLANAQDCRQVIATDIYNNPGVWSDWHGRDFVDNTAQYVPEYADASRILVRHADMCKLPFPDGIFDGIFSSGSIEHIGIEDVADWGAIAEAASEIGRVLKPGGIASLSTEWKLTGDGWGWANVRLFTPELIQRYIIDPSGLELVDEPDWSFDGDLNDAVDLSVSLQNKGTPELEYVLREQQFIFTSVHLALRKPNQ